VHRGIRACWVLALATTLGLMVAPNALARASRHVSAVTGKLYPVRPHTVGLAARAASIAPSAPVHGVRPIPRSTATTAAPLVATRPQAPGHALNTPAAATPLAANFNGVSSADSANTNFGQEFEPPDQGLCVGNGYVLEMVNSAYTVYRPNGTVVTGPFNVNGPFDEGLTEFTSDPRCEYDASTHTWYATILYINPAFTVSRVDLAVNTSGDPTKLWTDYQLNTTDIGGQTGPKHPGCPCLGDQPTLGIDSQNVYITTNEFSLQGPQFNGAQIYAIAKSQLTTPGPPSSPADFVHFDNLSIGGAVASSVQPALTNGSAPAEYLLNSLDPNGTFDQRVGVWAMTNRGVVATGGKPTLSSTVIGSEAYGLPPGAQQRGSSSLIDSGDDRMQQTQSIGGDVWGELTTAVTIPSDNAERAGAAWFDLVPKLNGTLLGSAHMRRQGYVTIARNNVVYPALQASPSGRVAMVMTLTGDSHYPSAAYSLMPGGGTTFGAVNVAAAGTGPYSPDSTRWGDYSWAVLSSTGKSVWVATEYVPPKASQTPDGAQNWGTRVLDVPTG
jgi:hypothetical protein